MGLVGRGGCKLGRPLVGKSAWRGGWAWLVEEGMKVGRREGVWEKGPFRVLLEDPGRSPL